MAIQNRDIEIPDDDGFTLTAKVRANGTVLHLVYPVDGGGEERMTFQTDVFRNLAAAVEDATTEVL